MRSFLGFCAGNGVAVLRSGKELRPKLLVGADGVNSRVRHGHPSDRFPTCVRPLMKMAVEALYCIVCWHGYDAPIHTDLCSSPSTACREKFSAA